MFDRRVARSRQKFSGGTDDADGFNPIAQTNGLKGGQNYEAHARIKNLERIADANESINEGNAGGGTWVKDVGAKVLNESGKVPRSRDKQPLGVNGSTSVPKAFQEIHARYGISSEPARWARMDEIEKKCAASHRVSLSSSSRTSVPCLTLCSDDRLTRSVGPTHMLSVQVRHRQDQGHGLRSRGHDAAVRAQHGGDPQQTSEQDLREQEERQLPATAGGKGLLRRR